MLLLHSLYYTFARGLPGLLSFAALTIFTRLLTPTEFGRYTLALSGIGLLQVIAYQWLQLVLARFLPLQKDGHQILLKSILGLFAAISVFVVTLGCTLILIIDDPTWKLIFAIAIPLTVAQSWIQINLTLISAQLNPSRYGFMLGCKNFLALILGCSFSILGFGEYGPLLGLLIGTSFAYIFFGRTNWKKISLHWPEKEYLKEYLSYGLPLAATFALNWVISSSDRFLISYYIDEAAAGIYSAGYDLAQQSLGLILMIINTAAYPLVMRQRDEKLARVQIQRNGELIITLALTSAAGLVSLSPYIANIVVGEKFRSETIEILPWIAIAAAVSGIKAYHLDIAFQLSRQSQLQAYTSIAAATINVLLNIYLIPIYGIKGAAFATLIAYVSSALVSFLLGNRIYNMPQLFPLLMRGLFVSTLTYFGTQLVFQLSLSNMSSLIMEIALGAIFTLFGVIIVDIGNIRTNTITKKLNLNCKQK